MHTHLAGEDRRYSTFGGNQKYEKDEVDQQLDVGLSPHAFRARIKNTEVTFNFTCANTSVGDQVAMVGSMALLGHWDPMRAVPLTTTKETYPIWTIKIDLPRDKIIEYKFLINKAKGKGQAALPGRGLIEWENLPQGVNRLISTHGKKEITIYESLGSCESVEEYVEAQ